MKFKPGIMGVSLALFTLVLGPASPAAEPVPAPALDRSNPIQKTLTGVIQKKTAARLTLSRLDGQGDVTVTLSESILITRADRPATVADLVAGLRVELTLKAGTSEATSIRILTATPKP